METKLSRREFLFKATSVLGIGAFAGAFLPMLTSCEQNEVSSTNVKPGEYTNLDLSQYPEFATIGAAKKLTLSGKNNGNPLLIYRAAATTFVVASSVCPHQQASLGIVGSGSTLDYKCPLHGATFKPADGTLETKGTTSDDIDNLTVFNSVYDSANNILKIEI